MKVSFFDAAREAFYTEKLEQAKREERRVDSYFCSLLYLYGLYHDTCVTF